MLDAADQTVRALIARRLPGGVRVLIDPPDASWLDPATAGPGIVDAFLVNVREDPLGRGADWADVRDDSGIVVARQPPLRRYELTYVVTAWAADAETEHRLLGTVLRTLAGIESVPRELLHGGLAEVGVPVATWTARSGGSMLPESFWTGYGLPVRAFLELVVVAPLLPDMVTDVAPPAEKMDLGVDRGFGASAPPGPTEAPHTPEAAPGSAAAGARSPRGKRGRAAASGPANGGDDQDGRPTPDGSVADARDGHAPTSRPDKKWTSVRIRERTPDSPDT